MKKKIALVSPHSEPNYGTMLQAFALAKLIEELGGSAEYISYERFVRKSIIEKIFYYIINPKRVIAKFIQKKKKNTIDDFSFFRKPEFTSTLHKFEEFYINNIPHTSTIYNPETIQNLSGYLKYIVGSDQTWSPNLYVPQSINFLDFVKDNSLKNSYAPSFGTTNISVEFQNLIKEKLINFNHLSCREKVNCIMIENLTGKEVAHVLDPTLLLTPEQWNEIVEDVQMPEKYVLCYILGERKCISDYAEMLGREKNIPVYYIATRPVYLHKENCYIGIGPSQFISLMKNAAYVVTDSYHGTIFCINFNCNFYSFMKREDNTGANDNIRLIEVLNEFRLTKRFREDGDMSLEDDITYDKVNETLNERRLESISYLKKIMHNQ